MRFHRLLSLGQDEKHMLLKIVKMLLKINHKHNFNIEGRKRLPQIEGEEEQLAEGET